MLKIDRQSLDQERMKGPVLVKFKDLFCLGITLGFTTYQLYDFGQVTYMAWNSVSFPIIGLS
jgi:hypothetical protein